MQSNGERDDNMLTKQHNPMMMFHADLIGATESSE
jgi:hypothetical protein